MLIGIDFGTSNSCAAVIIEGNLRLVKEPVKQGYSFPSSVYIDESGKILVGHFAESKKIKDISRYRNEIKADLIQQRPYLLGQNGEYEFTAQLQLTILRYTQAIQDSANQSCNEFQKVQSAFIDVSLPSYPKAYLPQRQDRNAWQWTTDIFNRGANRKRLDKEYERKKWDAYKKAIYNYLSEFSKNTLKSLNQYEQKVESFIVFPIPPESHTLIQRRSDLVSLKSSIDTIIDIEKAKNDKPDIYQFKSLEKLKVRFLFCKNWLSCFFRY